MSLSPAEVISIKRYLGYDLITQDAWRGNAAAGLDRNVGMLSDTAVVEIQGVLAELATIDAQIPAARGRLKAEQVGDLRINAMKEIAGLRAERKTVSRELARLLGVHPPDTSLGTGQVVV